MVGMTAVAMEETSEVQPCGGGYGGVGMALMDLAMMEAVLEAVEATMIWAVTTIDRHILDPRKEETLEAEALAPRAGEAVLGQTTEPRRLWRLQQQLWQWQKVRITARKQS